MWEMLNAKNMLNSLAAWQDKSQSRRSAYDYEMRHLVTKYRFGVRSQAGRFVPTGMTESGLKGLGDTSWNTLHPNPTFPESKTLVPDHQQINDP